MFTYIIMDSTLHVPDCNLPLSPGNSSHEGCHVAMGTHISLRDSSYYSCCTTEFLLM